MKTQRKQTFFVPLLGRCMLTFVFAVFCMLSSFSIDKTPSAFANGDEQLVIAQVIYRHGQRNPTQVCPTDEFPETAWPEGYGQLTAAGIRQQFELGRRLRQRYVEQLHFVSANYSKKQVFVQSTDVDRTLVSAMANLAGFYAIDADDFPTPERPPRMAPVPVHTVSKDEDMLRPYEGRPACPARQELLVKMLKQTPECRKMFDEHKAAFEQIAEHCGERMSIFQHDARLHSSLYSGYFEILEMCEKPLPKWLTPERRHAIDAGAATEVAWVNGVGTPTFRGVDLGWELARLRGGPLLWHLIEKMRAKVRSHFERAHRESARLIHYSAHDTTLAALLGALGLQTNVDRPFLTPFASTLLVELWRTTTGENHPINHTDPSSFYVKVLFWPGYGPNERRPPVMDISGRVSGCHGAPCSLEEFATRSTRFLPIHTDSKICTEAADLKLLLGEA